METKLEYISYGARKIEYGIKRSSRRRTVAISITPNANVIVSVPHLLNTEKIKEIVRKKVRWVYEKQEYFKRLLKLYPKKEFINGEEFLYLGRPYRLKLITATNDYLSKLHLAGRKIFISANGDKDKKTIRDSLVNWYFSESTKIIEQRVTRFSKLLGLYPKEVKIKDQQKRWGSCSREGILRFNWKITMAPVPIIDYIVVHELCHLKIKNHSEEFWRYVSLVLPNFKDCRVWLRNNASIFRI